MGMCKPLLLAETVVANCNALQVAGHGAAVAQLKTGLEAANNSTGAAMGNLTMQVTNWGSH